MTPRGLSALLVAATCAVVLTSPAAAASPTPASGATWEPNQVVGFRWKEAAEPPKWMKLAINAAAAGSTSSRTAKAAVISHRDGADSWVGYTANLPTNYAIGYAVRNIPHHFTVRLRPHGYVLDWGVLRWCQFYDKPPHGCYDAEMVTLHEFGHVQTLGHVDESEVAWLDSVMHEAPHSKAKIGWDMHAFGRCDVARLQIRYEALTSTAPYSTCLSLPAALALKASTTAPAYGGSVTFTAALRVSIDTQYPRLAGDPVSGRRVVLQRRLVGGSTWSNHVEMVPLTDDTGRYTRSLRITASYEWRARFFRSADEGLNGAHSGAVAVYVRGCTGTCPLGPDR